MIAGDGPLSPLHRLRWLAAAPSARVPRVLLLLLALSLGSAVYAGAVAVSPVAVYIDSRSRTGTLTLFNPGSLPEEIQIDFAFGYPVSDAEGNVSVPIYDSAPAGEPSAVAWTRAFPRRLVLEPGQRQVVRVVVEPPPNLPEGEYWARALVRSRGGQPPIEERSGNVAVEVAVETVVIVAVNYRNGSVRTGLEIVGAEATTAADTVQATIDFRRVGNAAFLGRLQAELLDGSGRAVAKNEEVLAVYKTIRRRVSLAPPAGAAGPFKIRFTMDADRSDLPPGGPLPVERRVYEVPVR